LIQGAAQSDSIIARSQCSKEFCNTFPPIADIRRNPFGAKIEVAIALRLTGYFDCGGCWALKSPVISADNRAPPTNPTTTPIDTSGYSLGPNNA
jgi:hypothetical protein